MPEAARLDAPGLVLSALGLGCAMYGVSEGPIQGWTSITVLAAIVVGLVLLTAPVIVELGRNDPLVDLRLFGNRLFRACTSLYAFGSVAYLGALYLAALLFQDALGLSAIQAGLTSFPAALGSMAGAQIVTRILCAQYGPRRVTAAGLITVAATLILMATVTTVTSLWLVRLMMFGLGLGISLVFIPSQAASMATIDRSQTSRASSIFNAGKQLGGAIGVALLTTILATGSAQHGARRTIPDITAFHHAFLAAAAVAIVTLGAALTIQDADAAAAVTRRSGRATPQTDESAAQPAPIAVGSRAARTGQSCNPTRSSG